MNTTTEVAIDRIALVWFESRGWCVAHGLPTAPDTPDVERVEHREIVLTRRQQDALIRLLEDTPCPCSTA